MRFAFIAALLCATATAAPLHTQGRLTDATGAPITGTRDVTVQLYSAALGGTLLWEAHFSDVTVEAGYYSLALDGDDAEGRTLDDAVAQSPWVSFWVDGQELLPRQPVSDVPRARHADVSDSVPVIDSAGSCDVAGAMGFDMDRSAGAICDGSSWHLLASTPADSPQYRLLVADRLLSTSEIDGTSSWQYQSLDGKAGPYTITTKGGNVRVYFKAMTYLYGTTSVGGAQDAGLIVHPVIDGVRQEYCDYLYVRGWGTNDNSHGPLVCDVTYDLPAGTYTIGFEHRYHGFRTVLYGGWDRSAIRIEELPVAIDHQGQH